MAGPKASLERFYCIKSAVSYQLPHKNNTFNEHYIPITIVVNFLVSGSGSVNSVVGM